MKNLVEILKEDLRNQNRLVNEAINPDDIKLFWKWVDALNEKEDIMQVINGKDGKNKFYAKVVELGTTTEQFELFDDIFSDLSNKFMDLIEDDEDAGLFDAGADYASWSAPFCGQKTYEQALKEKRWRKVCDEYKGLLCGYVMEIENYEEYLDDNDIDLDDLKGFK